MMIGSTGTTGAASGALDGIATAIGTTDRDPKTAENSTTRTGISPGYVH